LAESTGALQKILTEIFLSLMSGSLREKASLARDSPAGLSRSVSAKTALTR